MVCWDHFDMKDKELLNFLLLCLDHLFKAWNLEHQEESFVVRDKLVLPSEKERKKPRQVRRT